MKYILMITNGYNYGTYFYLIGDNQNQLQLIKYSINSVQLSIHYFFPPKPQYTSSETKCSLYYLHFVFPEQHVKYPGHLLPTFSLQLCILLSYPSGRIAVIRLQPPASSTLFFDDTDSPENQFLGCVTSSGCVLVKQPNLYTRFVTDSLHERGYLCNGETGIIEKQLRSHSNNPGTQSNLPNQTPANDDDEIFPPVLDSTVQLQLNSCMQLEYYNPINIRFAFACHKEEFKFQLGAHPSQLPSAVEATLISTKKHSADRKLRSKLSTIVSSSTHSSEISINSQVPVEKLPDGQVNVKELPMMKELTVLRKRIKHICISWLKECRTPLGKRTKFVCVFARDGAGKTGPA